MQLQEFRQDLDARMSAAKISGFWKQPDKDRVINKGVVRRVISPLEILE